MGGLRDELSKLPAVRPSPVGQENISTPNPASCPSMNYSTSYRNHQSYPTSDSSYHSQQHLSYYPSNDQHSAHSGSASLSSSSTSLNNDYYAQSAAYGMTGNQGYVNPMYHSPAPQNYQDMGNSQATKDASYSQGNNYQQPASGMNQYGSYAGSYAQQQPQVVPANHQYDYYKNQNSSVQQPAVSSLNNSNAATQNQSMNYNTTVANNNSYVTPTNSIQAPQMDQSQSMYQNQYQMPQQYPVAQSPVQQYPVAQSPVTSQYSGIPQYQNQTPVAQTSGSVQGQMQMPAQSQSQMPVQGQLQMPGQPQSQMLAQNQQPMQQQSHISAQNEVPISLQNQQLSLNQTQAIQSHTQMQTQNQMRSQDTQYSLPYSQNPEMNQQQPVAQQDYPTQQNYYGNNPNQMYVTNQYGQYESQFSQQNYSCFTPTVNAINSYMTATDGQTSQSQTTQSVNYSQTPQIVGHSQAQAIQKPSVDSPHHQPYAIPTNTAATNATCMNNPQTQLTHSQQQITSSHVEAPKPAVVTAVESKPAVMPAVVKSANIDLLSGIDFTMTNPTIENIPTLMPVSVREPVEESPQKVLVPQSPVAQPTPVKLNADLADLDFNSLSVSSPVQAAKVEVLKPKKLKDPFDDGAVLKQFHKEVESLEKFMETLTIKTLNGVTPLANKWKELQDLLVKDEARRSVSVARLFPDKNRSIDCLPYDHARVLLPTSTDNYINAVLVKDCGLVGFILAQTPMANTANDYWEMVWSQQSNTLVCLHSATEVRFLNLRLFQH